MRLRRVPVQLHPRQEHRRNAAAMAILAEPPGPRSGHVRLRRQFVLLAAKHLAQRRLRVKHVFPPGMRSAEFAEIGIDPLHPRQFVVRQFVIQQAA